jgi:hypothetical protein
MTRMPRIRTVALAVALGVVGGGCGSDAEPRPLDDEEASALSQVLVRNLDAAGASFTADVPFGPGSRLELRGDVDWVEHHGSATLTTFRDADGDGTAELTDEVNEVAWTDDAVALRPQGGAWTTRPADPAGIPLDQVIALIVASAGDQRDNPLLVAQSDASWIRADEVGDVAVDVIDGGGRIDYWIGDDGLLHRLDAEIAGFDGVTSIVFEGHGSRTIELPAT